MIKKVIVRSSTLYFILFILTTRLLALGTEQIANPSNFDNEKGRRFDYYYYEALNAKAQGKYDEAMDLFLHCHHLDSTNANLLVELGTFQTVLKEKEMALSYFKKAVSYDKTNYYYNMILAGLSKDLALKQEVIDILEYLRELYPDNLELLYEMAKAYADNEEFEKAIEQLNELEQIVGVSEMLIINKFHLYSLMKNREKAFETIEQIIEKYPDEQQYIILIGDLYMEDNQPEKALGYYEEAEAMDSDNPELILSMINYYEKVNNKAAAQTELEKAIGSSSMEADSKIELLTRYLTVMQQNKQDLKQANPLFKTLFEQYPNNRELNLIYGNLLFLQEDKIGAVEQYKIFIEDNLDNPAGYEQIIRVALPDEDYETVKNVTTQALKHIPDEPQFYYYLGAVNFQMANHKEALRVFEEGLEKAYFRNPVLKSDFHGQIGDIYHFMKKSDEAFLSYDEALRLNPQNLHVLNNYSYYLSLEGRELDKAEMMSGITIKAEPMNPTFLDTYGWVLFQQGSYILSKIYIEKAIEYSKDKLSIEIFEHYGDVLFKTGEEERALEQWKRAEELGGNSKTLKRKIKRGKL